MLENNPLVSVNMPVYNGEKFIQQAIDSILNQTYQNFELIIVNDGSTDESVVIINAYNDKRIKLYHNEKNSGLVFTRNKAIHLSQGKYIAILDCDDIAHPSRLEKQVNFLENHPEYKLVGSWFQPIDVDGNKTGDACKFILPDYLIKSELFFGNYFAQSAIMAPRNILNEIKYTDGFAPAEDYLLWSQIADRHPVHNIQEILLKYRIHGESISFQKREIQKDCVKRVYKFHLSKLNLPDVSDEQLEIQYNLSLNPNFRTGKDNKIDNFQVISWIDLLISQNDNKKLFNPPFFNLRLESMKVSFLNKSRSFRHILSILIFTFSISFPLKNNFSKFGFIFKTVANILRK